MGRHGPGSVRQPAGSWARFRHIETRVISNEIRKMRDMAREVNSCILGSCLNLRQGVEQAQKAEILDGIEVATDSLFEGSVAKYRNAPNCFIRMQLFAGS